jgi:hypothetical protein
VILEQPIMTTLTPAERARAATSSYARPQEQWAEILRDLSPEDAAARIFGDLRNYRADEKIRGHIGYQRRDGFLDDIANLARALQAWASK